MVSLSGCSMFQVGEDPTVCAAAENGGLPCTSARDIWEMTDNVTSLDSFNQELSEKRAYKEEHGHDKEDDDDDDNKYDDDDDNKYESKGLVNYPSPEERRVSIVYRNDENLPAPEPIAVRNAPKILRILLNSWEDDSGRLHMPGYTYVEIEPRKWVVGNGASIQPARITPLSIRKTSLEDERKNNPTADNGMGIIQRVGTENKDK